MWQQTASVPERVLLYTISNTSCLIHNRIDWINRCGYLANEHLVTTQLVRCVRGEYKVHSGDAKVYVQKSEQVRHKTKITFTQVRSKHHKNEN